MDLWVVAAAAGAGYFSKRLQNLSLSEKEKLVESYSKISNLRQSGKQNFLQQIWDETYHLRRLARKGVIREPSSEQNDVLDNRPLEMDQFGVDSDSAFGTERASTSGNGRMVEDPNVPRLSSLAPGFSGWQSCPHDMEFMDASSSKSCRVCKYKLLKSRSSGHALGRFSSVESNLEKVDEYVYNSLPTPPIPIPTIPLLVTDANLNVGGSSRHSFDSSSNVEEDTLSGACCNENNAFTSAPSLESAEMQEQAKQKTSQESVLGGAFQSSGPRSGMLLFLIGLTMGIMPEVFTCTRESKELNEKLKQAENLIQDLQEELDMKYKLTVEELAEEHSQPLSAKISSSFNDEPTMSCSDPLANGIPSYDSKMANNKEEENRQSMSKIEAELEAELERLGLNMDLERISDFVELDRQYDVDKIQGDIKLDAALRSQYENASESESDEESDTANGQTPPANYAVSPRDLSIRLHKVIESRLEARIKELETALQNTQNKFHSLESQCITSLGSAYSDEDTVDEVKGVTDKMTGKDPETNYAAYGGKIINPDVPPFETKLDDILNCRTYGFLTALDTTEDKRSPCILSDELRPWKEQL